MPIPEDEMDQDLFEDDHDRAQRLRAQYGIGPDQTPGSLATPTTPLMSDPGQCAHTRTTKHGSNAHKHVVKCKDCGVVLHEEKVSPAESMKTASPNECKHQDRDYRGSTGTTWKWKWKTCGHSETGEKSPGETARSASSRAPSVQASSPTSPIVTPHVTPSSSAATSDEDHDVDKIVDLMRHVVNIQRDMGQRVSLHQLDKIYERCRSNVVNDCRKSKMQTSERSRSGSVNRSPAAGTPTSVAPSPSGEVQDVRTLDSQKLLTGAYAGRTYADLYVNEMNHRKAMIGKLKNGSLSNPLIINYAKYATRRSEDEHRAGSSSAYMMTEDDMPAEHDKQIFAILDTGCNNTCHGDRWMQRYAEINGYMPSCRRQVQGSWRQGDGVLQTHHPNAHEDPG